MSAIKTNAKPALDFIGSTMVSGTMRGVRRAALNSEIDLANDACAIHDRFPNLYKELCGKTPPEIMAHIDFIIA